MYNIQLDGGLYRNAFSLIYVTNRRNWAISQLSFRGWMEERTTLINQGRLQGWDTKVAPHPILAAPISAPSSINVPLN